VAFNLAKAKIAYSIVWNSPDKFPGVVTNVGGFHIMCAYMGATGKMMAGSAFEQLVLQSGICTTGSMNQIMSGKHYNLANRVHAGCHKPSGNGCIC